MAVSQAPVVSEASATVAPPVVGGTVTALPSAVQDLTKFFLSLTGSSSQGVVDSVASATVPTSGSSAPGVGAVASCVATASSSVADRTSSASAAVPGSSGRQQREEEFSRHCRQRCRSSSGRKSSPATVDGVITRPAVGPVVRVRNVLGNDPLPLVGLLVARRSPIDLLRVLLKKIEPSLLLPPLNVRMEVHLAIHAPLQRVTARPVLALRAGGCNRPL